MRRFFADTHFFLALLSERDVDHSAALGWWNDLQSGDQAITTAWVLVELADGMKHPHSRTICVRFVDRLRTQSNVRIIEADATLFWRGFELYRQREDKEWSLTDCISFVVMGDHEVTKALTGDRHFEQAGFMALLAVR